jgi:hypothetical protein
MKITFKPIKTMFDGCIMLTMGEVLSSPTHCAGRPAHSQVPCDLWENLWNIDWFYGSIWFYRTLLESRG